MEIIVSSNRFFRSFLLLLAMGLIIDARQYSCPEEYRELRRRDDSNNDDQLQEGICEEAMDLSLRERNSIHNQWILNTFCAHYDEASELTRENNDTSCQEKKRAIEMRRKREDSSDSDDDDDQDKRQALRKRELSKRWALRFIRKRLS